MGEDTHWKINTNTYLYISLITDAYPRKNSRL